VPFLLLCNLHVAPVTHPFLPLSFTAQAAACGFAEVIARAYSRNEGPIRIHWLPQEVLPHPGRLGTTIIPGRKWRDVRKDLDHLRAAGVRRLLCLANEHELFECDAGDLRRLAEEQDIAFAHVPIFFHSAPSVGQVCYSNRIGSSLCLPPLSLTAAAGEGARQVDRRGPAEGSQRGAGLLERPRTVRLRGRMRHTACGRPFQCA